ncbi:MAG: tRNA lysidine(34) synthetase TilS [Dehalococcoidia bacterium]|nr:tRNA lysidine(34) synthetase TilS [Dehalococcoidia bacterium]MDP7240240.1 tRNA lysidine(34) synthetase TilS [Dehalococcoidia bacterium]
MLAFIREHGLLHSGETVVVAVSGGPDSLCLLHLLHRLRSELCIGLHTAHLDHMLRGAEAAEDASFVEHICQGLGVPFTVERQDVSAYRRRHRLSMEEASRRVRYRFLARVARDAGAGRVVVGHTSDDQVETVLMNLVRGAGARGLRGMAPVSSWPEPETDILLVRPLLSVSHSNTEAYCGWLRLSPRQDISNLHFGPLRNRIRGRLLPLLQSMNPRVQEALLRTAQALTLDTDFLAGAVEAVWQEVVTGSGGGLCLHLMRFRQLHPALQRHMLLRAAGEVIGREDVEMVHVESALRLLYKPGSHHLTLPRGLTVTTLEEHAWLGKGEAPCPLPPLEGEYPLRVPGKSRLPGWRVTATISDSGEADSSGPGDDALSGLAAYMDFDAAGSGLTVRPRRPGDRFRPLGLGGDKKLQDFMVDARIPRPWRGRVPVVCSPRHLLWLVGWGLDERVRVRPDTHRVLRLEFQQEGA